jgi:hypothetical protein
MVDKIKRGNKLYIEKVDKAIIKTALSGRDSMFKFDPRFMKHIKMPSLAGIEQQWGYPLLIATLKAFLHAAILKKANEAIALDYLIPLRIVFPASSGTFDPTQMMNLELWKSEFIKSVKQWRRDPLHIEIAPVPIGRVQVGGEGRQLLTFQEVQVEEENILAALGIPKEIIYGSLQWKAAPITLRLLSKQLEPIIYQLNDLVQWIADTVAFLEQIPEAKAEMIPFKLIDDTDEKIAMIQGIPMPQPGMSTISLKTMGELLNIDFIKEQEQIMHEAVENERRRIKLQHDIQRVSKEEELAQQSQAMNQVGMAPGVSGSSAENSILQEAQQYAEQLLNVDPTTRKQQLLEIKRSRPVLHATIKEIMEDMRSSMEIMGRKQINPNA